MTETNKLILKLISENTSIEEICCILNLTRKQLHYRLRKLQEIGYDIKANYTTKTYVNEAITSAITTTLNTEV